MAPPRLRAVLPKDKISALYPQSRITKWLTEVGKEFQEAMKFYPPKMPWKNGFPKSGPRRGGRRTGKYKKGWNKAPKVTQAAVEVTNDVSYARYVGGPLRARDGRVRQALHMRVRGWPSQSTVGPAIAKANLPRLRKLVLPVRNP